MRVVAVVIGGFSVVAVVSAGFRWFSVVAGVLGGSLFHYQFFQLGKNMLGAGLGDHRHF